MSAERTLSSERASELVVWTVDAVSVALGVKVNPVKMQKEAREALGTAKEVGPDRLAEALKATATVEGVRLDLAAGLSAAELDHASLPLVAPGVLVREKKGVLFHVLTADGSDRWVSAEQALALAPEGTGWFGATPVAPMQEVAHHPSPFNRLGAVLRLERDDLWVVAIYAAVVGLFTLATPIAVQSLVGTVAFGTLLQPIVVLSFLFLVALSFSAVLNALQARVVELVQQRLFVRVATDLAWRLPRVRREEVDHGFGHETVNRFFDVVTVQKSMGVLLTDGVATILQVGIGLLVLAFYHPALLAFALVLVAAVTALVAVPVNRAVNTAVDESYAKYDVAGWLQQLAHSTAAFRGLGGSVFAAERADALTRTWLAARRRHFSILFRQTLLALGLQVTASATLLGLGGWLVVQRELTLGQLVAAEIIVAAVTSGLAKVGKLLETTYDMLAALDKLGHLVDLPIEDPERGEPVPGDGPARVEVTGATDGESQPISVTIPAGARVAITGAEGHHLAEWLAGLRIPSRGTVVLNGVETARARAPVLRDRVALVRRGDLFEGSVLENITLGRTEVTAADARAALEKVGLLEEIRALPEGLDTHLTHGEAPLNASQTARLLLARAIAGNPRLMVVDESLEVIEPLARARCVTALTRPSAPWTLVALVTEPSVALARGCSTLVSLDELASHVPPPSSPTTQEVAS